MHASHISLKMIEHAKKISQFLVIYYPIPNWKNSQDAFINYTTLLLYYLCQNSISPKLSLLSHRHVKSNGIVTGIISPSLEEKKAATLGESSANYDESGARQRDGKKENERSVGEKKEKKNKVCGFRATAPLLGSLETLGAELLPDASRANLIRARLIPLFLLPRRLESPVRARAREDEG